MANAEYFKQMVEKYEERNQNLMKRLEDLYARIDVMETTAPALLMYNLFKETESKPSVNLEEYISGMLPVTSSKPSTSDGNLAFPDITSSSLDSNDLLQLIRLETLLKTEKQVLGHIDKLGAREVEIRETISKIDRGEIELEATTSAEGPSANVELVDGDNASTTTEGISLADQLDKSLMDIEMCCSCQKLATKNMKDFVNKLIKAVRYCRPLPSNPTPPKVENVKLGDSRVVPKVILEALPKGKCYCSGQNKKSPNELIYFENRPIDAKKLIHPIMDARKLNRLEMETKKSATFDMDSINSIEKSSGSSESIRESENLYLTKQITVSNNSGPSSLTKSVFFENSRASSAPEEYVRVYQIGPDEDSDNVDPPISITFGKQLKLRKR